MLSSNSYFKGLLCVDILSGYSILSGFSSGYFLVGVFSVYFDGNFE